MKTFTLKTLLAGVAGLLLGVNAPAQTWNFENDYAKVGFAGAGAVNPAGVWSLSYQATNPETQRDGNYALLPNHTVNLIGVGLDAWLRSGDGSGLSGFPWIGVNTTGSDPFGFITPGQSYVLPADPTIAVIRWTAPQAGVVDIGYRFNDRQAGGAGHDWGWYVTLNGNDMVGGVLDDLGDTGLQTLSGFGVLAGDNIHWIVGAGTGDNADDVVRVLAQVTYIPEPGTMALLGLGGLAWIWRRRMVRS